MELSQCLIIYRKPSPFKRQPHKMVKHTETIRRQQPTNCLSVSDHFVGLALKGLKLFPQLVYILFTHFRSMLLFYTPENIKNDALLMFLGGIKN